MRCATHPLYPADSCWECDPERARLVCELQTERMLKFGLRDQASYLLARLRREGETA